MLCTTKFAQILGNWKCVCVYTMLHGASDLDQRGFNIPRKESEWWCYLKFWKSSPPPQKKWNFGPPIGLSGMSDKKFKIYISLGLLIIWTPLRQSWRNYYGWWLPWMGLLGGPTTSPNKSKMAVCSHIQFRKMLISPYWYLCKSW